MYVLRNCIINDECHLDVQKIFNASAEDRRLCFYLLSVCLSVRPLNYSKSYEGILMNFFGGRARGRTNNGLDFGVDPGSCIRITIHIQEFFQRIFDEICGRMGRSGSRSGRSGSGNF